MRTLLVLSILLPLTVAQGIFARMFEDEDPEGMILKQLLDADDDFPSARPIRPAHRTAKYMRNSASDDDSDEPRIVRPVPVRAYSPNSNSGSRPRSVSSIDNSDFPAGRFLDTATNLFANMFSMFKPEQVTWHVSRPDPEDVRPTKDDESLKEGSGERSFNSLDVANDDEPRDHEDDIKQKALDRVVSFFDKIGSSAIASSQLRGPHICVREITKKMEPSKNKSTFRECKRFDKAVRCIERQTDKKSGLETTRIQECCAGFDTDDISDQGCNRESHILSARDVLTLANSTMVELLDELGLAAVLDGPEQYTIIVPPNEAIARIQRSEYTELRALLANHVLEGDLKDYEMTDGSEFNTRANASVSVAQKDFGRKQRTLVNCVPLTTTNIRTSSGTIHHSANSIGLSSSSILEYLEESNRFKTFVSLITPDLERKLRSTDGRYTVFAFSDAAFAALSESVRTNVISKSACVNDLIINHIVKGALCSSELEDRTVISMGGHVLRVHTMVDAHNGTHTVHIGSARITEADRFNANGVVHVIDDVILLENLLTWRDHLLTFNQPLLDALADLSMDGEPLTIFVPPANSTTGSLDMDVFALNHVAEHRLVLNPAERQTVTTVTNSTYFLGVYKTASPFSIHIATDSTGPRTRPIVGCARIVNQSIHACNSVLHFIDKPLPIVEGDLAWLFSTRKELSRFHALWQASDAADLLNTTEPLTVFAPSDDAMSRNQFNALLKNETMLNAFVRRYIVKGPLCSFDLRSRATEFKYDLIPNEAGEVLRPDTYGGQLHIDGARVQEEEIVLSNGVVHVLETPITKIQGSSRSMPPVSFADILGLTNRMFFSE